MISPMTGVFIDLRRALAGGDLRTASALLQNYPRLVDVADLSAAERQILRGWGLLPAVPV